MKKVIVILLLLVIGAAAYGAASYHMIRTDEKVYVVQKKKMGFEQVYADTRGWGVTDWAQNNVIREALARAKSEELGGKVNQGVDEFKEKSGLDGK